MHPKLRWENLTNRQWLLAQPLMPGVAIEYCLSLQDVGEVLTAFSPEERISFSLRTYQRLGENTVGTTFSGKLASAMHA